MNTVHALLLALLGGTTLQAQASNPSELHVVAQSHEAIWNAVAVGDAGELYTAGPRWTGSRGPSVARIDAKGQAQPFPDARWNSDDVKIPADQRFINVNAIHRDASAGLWVVDTGVSDFGGSVIPGGAKLVRIDLASAQVSRVINLGADIAKPQSYVDDIRFQGNYAYLTDAGVPGLIVLQLDSGTARRVLEDSPSTHARNDRAIVVEGQTVRAPDGSVLRVNADPLELSPDGQWLYFAPLTGPWSRIETRWLNDPTLSRVELAKHVLPWVDLPPVGGTLMDRDGNMYFTDLAANALRRLTPALQIETIVSAPQLHWVDAPARDNQGRLYLPAAQMDRVALFNGGEGKTQWPLQILRLDAPTAQETNHDN